MANLSYSNNPAQYPDVYQLERADPVDAGTGGNGVSNLQAKQLTERTDFLKNQIEAAGGPVVQTNTGSTLTVADVGKKFVVGAGSQTFILPLANTCKSGAIIEVVARIGSVTVQRQGSDTILKDDSVSSITIADNQFVKFACNGTNAWVVIARGFIENYVPPVAVGSVIMHAGSTAPQGYLECDGAVISRTTFADLFAVIGTTYGAGNGVSTFKLPDLRGEFVRGWDNGRGVDTGRTFGSNQQGTIHAIDSTGTNQLYAAVMTSDAVTPGNAALVAERTGLDYDANGATNYPNTTAAYANGDGSGGFNYGISRPRNVALLYCIKV